MYMSELIDNLDSTTLATMYLDFEKAFDKVSHGNLLEKFHKRRHQRRCTGINRKLSGRKRQKVKIGSLVPSDLLVQCGVPQGSVLGPSFLILSINDLPKCVMSTCFGYANDYKNIAKNGITLQIDTHKIWKWCSSKSRSLNTEKM